MENRICPKCKKTKSADEFYVRRKTNSSSYCKACVHVQTLDRQKKFKAELVTYKGGSCERCNYDKCMSALEFHHRDPSEKDFTISKYKCTKVNDTILKEIDKCMLVCANCHREIHHEISVRSSVG